MINFVLDIEAVIRKFFLFKGDGSLRVAVPCCYTRKRRRESSRPFLEAKNIILEIKRTNFENPKVI